MPKEWTLSGDESWTWESFNGCVPGGVYNPTRRLYDSKALGIHATYFFTALGHRSGSSVHTQVWRNPIKITHLLIYGLAKCKTGETLCLILAFNGNADSYHVWHIKCLRVERGQERKTLQPSFVAVCLFCMSVIFPDSIPHIPTYSLNFSFINQGTLQYFYLRIPNLLVFPMSIYFLQAFPKGIISTCIPLQLTKVWPEICFIG